MNEEALRKRVLALQSAILERVDERVPHELAQLVRSLLSLAWYGLLMGPGVVTGPQTRTGEFKNQLVEYCDIMEGLLKVA